jgi:hypothetical protein
MGAPPRSLPSRRPRLRWPVGPTSRNPDPSRAGLAAPDTHAGDRDDPPAPRGYDGDVDEQPERLAGALLPGTASSNTLARGRRGDTRRKVHCNSRNLPTDDRPRAPRRRPICWPPEARCAIVPASARPRDQGGRERQLSAFRLLCRRWPQRYPRASIWGTFWRILRQVSTDRRGQSQFPDITRSDWGWSPLRAGTRACGDEGGRGRDW